MSSIHQILKQYWGYHRFRPVQQEIIEAVLAGNDTLALLPTGGGKSICFQVPAMAMSGMCLVVSPLIALMKDQVFHLQQKGISAAAIFSGQPHRVTDTLLDNAVYGKIKFLYLSPERLANETFTSRMGKMPISLIAVDEAHCISQWGYDFRPPYLRIADIREKMKAVPVIALTATATPEVAKDIQDKLLFKNGKIFQKSFVRNNLSYVVRQTANKEQTMLDVIQKVNGSGIVYVRNRKRSKEFASLLKKNGIAADYYHAGLEPNERSKKQEDWVNNKTRIICCTNAFGMGIDKPDVRVVVHMDLADSTEAYFQEAGRAGRDEKKAFAVQLFDAGDLAEIKQKISNGFPELQFIREVYDAICNQLQIAYGSGAGQSFDFELSLLADKMKCDIPKLLYALKILEQQEIIAVAEDTYKPALIQCVCTKDTLAQFQVNNKGAEPLIKFILRTSEGVFQHLVPIDEQVVAVRLKMTIEEVLRQLHHLHQLKIFNFQPRKNKPQIMLIKARVKRESLLLDRIFIEERKSDFENRLKGILSYTTNGVVCRTRTLVKYFGETVAEDCGICDVCVSRKKSTLSDNDFTFIADKIKSELKISPANIQQLVQHIKFTREKVHQVIDCMLEEGKITTTEEGKLKWLPDSK